MADLENQLQDTLRWITIRKGAIQLNELTIEKAGQMPERPELLREALKIRALLEAWPPGAVPVAVGVIDQLQRTIAELTAVVNSDRDVP